MAHLGALEVGGKTIAVLGSGVDVVYPSENMNLYQKIIASGAVISEFPMGTRADRQNFPIRNRIVAGMSLATLVVESDIKGGSMITARVASEYGRDVFAIPGRIDSPLSRGCNALIRDGAILASTPEDIIDALNFAKPIQMSLFDTPQSIPTQSQLPTPTPKQKPSTQGQPINTPKLSNDELTIYKIIERETTIHIDTLCELSNFEMKRCLPILLMLEIKRLIIKDAGGNYSLRK
jgi:DNA processing protein